MKSRKFQLLTQTLGTLALIAFAALGLMSVLGYDAPLVSAAAAEQQAERAATAATSINIPATFNYEGTLRNPDGSPKNGSVTIVANLYGAALNGATKYSETFTGVSVREGEFNIVLGDSPGGQDLTAVFENNAPLYVGISIDGASEIIPRERVHPVPWAVHARDSYDGVPVGGIVDWWRPVNDDNLYPIPDGFLACDGQMVNDSASPLNGIVLPDFTSRVALGSPNLASIGGSGGSNTTDAAGTHLHNLNTFDAPSGKWWAHDAAGQGFVVSDWGGIEVQTQNGSTFRPLVSGGSVTMYSGHAGDHTHTSQQPYIYTLKLCRTR